MELAVILFSSIGGPLLLALIVYVVLRKMCEARLISAAKSGVLSYMESGSYQKKIAINGVSGRSTEWHCCRSMIKSGKLMLPRNVNLNDWNYHKVSYTEPPVKVTKQLMPKKTKLVKTKGYDPELIKELEKELGIK